MRKVIAFGVNLDVVAKLSENSNFEVFRMRLGELGDWGDEHSVALQKS